MFYPEEEISSIFLHFATTFAKDQNNKENAETSHLYSYYDVFVKHETYQPINYISPFAKDLVQDPLVNGIQLDTTWDILKNYVTSIPMLIVQNVGISTGFQFCLHESISLYLDFFDYFKNIFCFKINDYILIAQTYQGKSLSSAVGCKNMQHLCCLHHLLTSLGKTKFSSQIGKLVTVTSQKDYDTFKATYKLSWINLSENDKQTLKDQLSPVGLTFYRNKIKISDPER